MVSRTIPLSLAISPSTPPLTPDSSSPLVSAVGSLSSRRGSNPFYLDFSSLSSIREPATPTDTLILTNIAPDAFEEQLMTMLKDSIEDIALITSWIPLKCFTRVVVSFSTSAEAMDVRMALDGQALLQHKIKIFYGENSNGRISRNTKGRLEVPALERNWLISPPGSPPVGWTQIKEDPPNSQMLHHDLIAALSHIPCEKPPSPISPQHDQQLDLGGMKELTLLKSTDSMGPEIVVHLDNSSDYMSEHTDLPFGREGKVSMVRTSLPAHR